MIKPTTPDGCPPGYTRQRWAIIHIRAPGRAQDKWNLLPRELCPPKLMQKDQFLPFSSLPPMSPTLRICVAQLSSGFGRIGHSKTCTQIKGRNENYEVPLPLNRKVSSKMPGDKPKGLLSNSCLDRHSGKYQSTAQDQRPPPSHLVQQTEDESLSGTSVSPFLSALFFQSGQAPKETHLSVLFSSLKAISGDSHCPPCCFKDSTQADSSWPRLLPLSLPGSVL